MNQRVWYGQNVPYGAIKSWNITFVAKNLALHHLSWEKETKKIKRTSKIIEKYIIYFSNHFLPFQNFPFLISLPGISYLNHSKTPPTKASALKRNVLVGWTSLRKALPLSLETTSVSRLASSHNVLKDVPNGESLAQSPLAEGSSFF